MPNIVIASKDPLCQSAKNWFVKNQNCLEGPPADALKDGEMLLIIAHDRELGDAVEFTKWLSAFDTPMTKFKVVLIVCSAASHLFGKDLLSPAERIANFFQRDVYASKTMVYGQWQDNLGASFMGDYVIIPPNTDITSLIANLKL